MNGHSFEIMTVPDVARYLKVSAKTVYSLIKTGSLHAFRVGRVLRCRISDVEEFIVAQAERDKEGLSSDSVTSGPKETRAQ